MSQRSVFAVAADIFRISGLEYIPSVKLQKLVYYVFGWYGRLTGEELFGQTFYAMKHGPVVSELLSSHAGKTRVTRDLMEVASDDFQDMPQKEDLYYEQVLRAVLGFYDQFDQWALRDLSHQETVWIDAWESRQGERGDLDRAEIIRYFLARKDVPESLIKLLPVPQVTYLSGLDAEGLEAIHGEYPRDFIQSLRSIPVA